MKGILQVVSNKSERGRQETIGNEVYTVYPVIMLTVGVHSGSGGPTLYTEEELINFSQTWNGVPVTLQHPELEDQPVSANSPEIYELQVLGTVFNTHYENGKLKAEIWLKNSRIDSLVPRLRNALINGERLEVSTGLFCEEDQSSGVFNNEEYASVARNIRPDHLALLPGGVGACSWEDGCGVRSNKDKEGKMIKTKKVKVNTSDKKWDEVFVNSEEFTINEMDYTQILNMMREKIDSMDIQGERINFLRKMYQDYAIYEVRNSEGKVKFYKREYDLTDNGVEWTTDPVEVRMMDDPFVEVQNNNSSKIIKTKKTNKEERMKTMKECCPDKVDELIENNANFKEEDRDLLLGMTEDQFAMTINVSNPIEKEETITNEKEETEETGINTFDELYANASPELKESVEYGRTLVNQKKKELIDKIKANKGNSFSEEELKGFKIDFLEKLAAMSPTQKNYVGNNGSTVQVVENQVTALPDPHDWEKVEK